MSDAPKRRAWGTGRICKRKRSRFFYIRYYDLRGKRHSESTRSTKRGDAERLLRDRLARKDRGELRTDARRVTFGDLATMILADYRTKNRRSWRRLEDALARLSAFFEGDPVHEVEGDKISRVLSYVGGSRALDITPDRIAEYKAQRLRDGAAPATIQIELMALRRMFTIAVRAGRLPQSPHVETMGPLNNARQGFFEEADFTALLTELPDYLRPVMLFAYHTGWRVQSEVLPLRWQQVDLKAGIVRLEPGTTKNDEGREFPFDVLPPLKAVLVEQRVRTSAVERATGTLIPWVFHHDGRPIRSYRRAWKGACKRAARGQGEGDVRMLTRPQLIGRIVHDLRRTAVRNLERAGVPRSVAMKLTGHKTEAVYRRYAIVAESDLREGVGKLAALTNSSHQKQNPKAASA
ncbi:MAG: site-specific integrase [Gemmatimonadales bacterium]|jgi:integrase